MALKKSQLYSSLWKSCDQLRGGMDASQYKDYVLTLLFMKYVSDKYDADLDSVIKVPEGGGWTDMVACRGQTDIGDRINKIIARLAEANELKGVIDQADFNDDSKLGRGKAMQDRLSKLVGIFESLDLGTNGAGGDDLLGDAYEYLMRHFATQSGKAKGQFYTPAEVSRIMAQVIGIGPDTRQDYTIYDPTCGSGSLLLRAADEAPRGLTIYGQEMDNATWGLARMNMILHGHPTADLKHGNVLADPQFTDGRGLKTFDFAVANPPFSTKSWSNGFDPLNDQFGRFEDGIPPTKNGDFAFLLHLAKSLKSRGRGAIILPHGVLFRSRGEADIRRSLLGRGLIKGVIGLPANLFFGTTIRACVVVIDKNDAHARRDIFMIDASQGFKKDGAKNRLRAQDIRRIVDVFNQQTETPGYSRMVPFCEISDPANDYNLNIPRYIDSCDPDDVHDLYAHMHGGIPDRDLDALSDYWKVCPSLRSRLFKSNGRPGYSDLRVAPQDVETTTLGHCELMTYESRIATVFNDWYDTQRIRLRATTTSRAADLLKRLGESLLVRFTGLPLLDHYDIYQCLMDYWDETMRDDVYMVSADGWVDAVMPRQLSPQVKGKPQEKADLILRRQKWKMDLVPPALVVARYFADDKASVEALHADHEAAERELEAYLDENSGEDGLLEGVENDKGKVTKARLDHLITSAHDDEERKIYQRCSRLLTASSKTRKMAKSAQDDLDACVLAKYRTLTELAIMELVIEDKWLEDIRTKIDSAVRRVLACLVDSITLLVERYSHPLPNLEQAVSDQQRRVMTHLVRMGIVSDTASCSPGVDQTYDRA